MFHAVRNGRRRSAISIATTMLSAMLVIAGGERLAADTKKTALVGSWLETVTFPPEIGRPPLQSLGSFHADGTVVCSDQGSVSLVEPQGVFTSCHGVWAHLDERRFAYTTLELISDLSGNLVGYLKVRGTYTVAESGNEYTGVSVAEIRDTGGTLLFSAEVTNAGKRIQVELP